MTDPKLSHTDEQGQVHMVDVGHKTESERMAVAMGEVRMNLSTLELIRSDAMKKGNVFTVAQIAGISAAKKTAELIPLCHPLELTHISVELKAHEELPGIQITATV